MKPIRIEQERKHFDDTNVSSNAHSCKDDGLTVAPAGVIAHQVIQDVERFPAEDLAFLQTSAEG